MINRTPSRSQSMNLIHLTPEGSELWLGDYYAATKMPLLKENNIRSGAPLSIQSSQPRENSA
jgi:hypothetical protein